MFIMHSFRRIFGEAGPNDREVRILHGLWSRIDWAEGERKKGEGERKGSEVLSLRTQRFS